MIKAIGAVSELLSRSEALHASLSAATAELTAIKAENGRLREEVLGVQRTAEEQRKAMEREWQEEADKRDQETEQMVKAFAEKMAVGNAQMDEMRQEVREKDARVRQAMQEMDKAQKGVKESAEVIDQIRRVVHAMASRMAGLVFQKKVVVAECIAIKDAFQKTQNFLERVYYKIRDLNLDVDSSDSSFMNQPKTEEFKEVISPLSKFKSAVACIIAINRIKLLTKSTSDGFGKFTLEDLTTSSFLCPTPSTPPAFSFFPPYKPRNPH